MDGDIYEAWYGDVLRASTVVDFEGLHWEGAGFILVLKERGSGARMRLSFQSPPVALGVANESQRLVSLRKLQAHPPHSFYIVGPVRNFVFGA